MGALRVYNGTTWETVGATGATGATGAAGTNGTDGLGYDGITSTTSIAIGTGSKAFTVNKVGALAVGTRVRVAYTTTPANYMEGYIATISSLTVTVTVDKVGGTGTFASWTFSVAGDPGTATPTAPSGTTSGTVTTSASVAGYMGMPQAATTTGALALDASHAGKHVYSTATRTVTIPANSAVAYEIGTTISFIAASGATVTIAITTDTLLLAGTGAGGAGTSRTLAAHGMATAVKVASTTWYISGNGLT